VTVVLSGHVRRLSVLSWGSLRIHFSQRRATPRLQACLHPLTQWLWLWMSCRKPAPQTCRGWSIDRGTWQDLTSSGTARFLLTLPHFTDAVTVLFMASLSSSCTVLGQGLRSVGNPDPVAISTCQATVGNRLSLDRYLSRWLPSQSP
jgi:hypothetical protein